MSKKIVHLAIANVYKEGMGYQENILPVKHMELGYEVAVITYHRSNDPLSKTYTNKDGIKVYILTRKESFWKKLPYINCCINCTIGLYEKLIEINPDIIFIHGLQAVDNLQVCKYKKGHQKVKIFVDQHGDYYNMPITTLKNRFVQKTVYRFIAKKLEHIAQRMWGVTPWRVDYLQKVYGISSSKTGLLIMGGDEKLIEWENKELVKQEIRKRYNIPADSFLIVSGGKIDTAKNIHLLLEAVNLLKKQNIILLIFGQYDSETQKICERFWNEQVRNIGWIDSQYVYSIFLASDLGVFPGTHSVLWEQACASGLPCIFKNWNEGMSHVNVGGNCMLINDISIFSIKEAIQSLVNDRTKYQRMKYIASTKARKQFSYIEIAKKSIEII